MDTFAWRDRLLLLLEAVRPEWRRILRLSLVKTIFKNIHLYESNYQALHTGVNHVWAKRRRNGTDGNTE